MRNLKMILEYDGSRYKGWQKQSDNDLTVQGKLEGALSKMAGEPIEVTGCVRTDVGVHAENYMANFHTNCELSIDEMRECLYEFLPEDIVVKSMVDASEKFHAGYNIKSITYVYKINNNELRNVFNRKYVYHSEMNLNLEEMRITAESLVGSHDFKYLATVSTNTKSTTKTINYINITEKEGIIEIEINADEFLWNMVRIIIGSLLEVGKGKIKAMDIEKLLNEETASEYIPMAKAKGLSLRNVEY
ncbi:tRNA pseudouridine(38-40) synthase TruA [Clostridium sp. CF011]|uniref:tRNA pseudouridine(38-40) synthase TruA n=1 Tax=unclassified Clostridium TaxID=2614128 RepID=UPI001C0D9DC2|nr:MULTISPECIES: tRNA pseudouridine(38-40) synthase TruA [unclassified Clostridium]MBU3093214.1 tRNA pseudouridine(38-40) synthase TruA [Clostridium sp. CF011]MBW9144723.1 tRNA pseudouridine(38-40) synthase TruA [Clostridium sp. CM027]UVE40527.1 tRNA pseudouridine(38-40) synthase TruA [Clostridium sp. CM027]WAG69487.1 tRNA pseudouridine(38-40) synthase TruA [Clostridium sp. CF011]